MKEASSNPPPPKKQNKKKHLNNSVLCRSCQTTTYLFIRKQPDSPVSVGACGWGKTNLQLTFCNSNLDLYAQRLESSQRPHNSAWKFLATNSSLTYCRSDLGSCWGQLWPRKYELVRSRCCPIMRYDFFKLWLVVGQRKKQIVIDSEFHQSHILPLMQFDAIWCHAESKHSFSL